ncbi:hypothetical protein AB7B99_28510 [Klebsiella pneumoniae]
MVTASNYQRLPHPRDGANEAHNWSSTPGTLDETPLPKSKSCATLSISNKASIINSIITQGYTACKGTAAASCRDRQPDNADHQRFTGYPYLRHHHRAEYNFPIPVVKTTNLRRTIRWYRHRNTDSQQSTIYLRSTASHIDGKTQRT